MKRKVCVIGAGPSGITAIKNLIDEGIEVQAFDGNDKVGGNWLYSEEPGHSSVFSTTHIISSKTLSQYEDFPFDHFDPTIPDYPSHQQLAAYFQAYAQYFDLGKYIQFNSTVTSVSREGPRKWLITVESEHSTEELEFTDLVVCNGHHWNPRLPEYPGKFDGEVLHSHDFKYAQPFKGKRVLVIGGGNSACDVAVETSRVSKKTDISWRRGYRIIPKIVFGKPSDTVSKGLSFLPLSWRNKISDFLISILVGPNSNYNLQEPTTPFGATHPTINNELLYQIRHGKVFPKVDIDRLEGKSVSFTDGTSEKYDVIIFCTGYKITHPFFDKSFLDYSEGQVPLYLKMMHPTYDDLYFIGLFQPLGCIWPGSELQSKIVAREISGKWHRPKDIHSLVRKELASPHYKQIPTARHTITVDFLLFKKELLRHLPKDYISKEAQVTK